MRLRSFPPVESHKLGTVKLSSVAIDNFNVVRGGMSESQVGCCCKIHFSSDTKKTPKNLDLKRNKTLWQKILLVLTVSLENIEVVLKPPLNQKDSECTTVLAHMDKNVRINSRLQEFSLSALIA